MQNEEDFENVFHPSHSYMYDVPGYPDLTCASGLHIKVLSAKFGYSKPSFAEASHPCVFDFTSQYQAGQCSTNRLSFSEMGCPVRQNQNPACTRVGDKDQANAKILGKFYLI